jgi:hypothetical protein
VRELLAQHRAAGNGYVTYEKELWLVEQLNYQVAPDVNGCETCNQRCRAITQIGVKTGIGVHGLPPLH